MLSTHARLHPGREGPAQSFADDLRLSHLFAGRRRPAARALSWSVTMLLLVVAWLAIIEDAAAIRFVSASRDQTSRIWNSASSNTEAAKPIKQGGNVLSVALNTDGRLIATGSTEHR